MSIRHFLLIPHIRIHNANAMSSPYTIGFPAMTAWLGAMHALQRKLQALPSTNFYQVQFKRMAVSCHQLNLQTHKGKGDYVHSIIGSSNPLDKEGNRPAFIEEARCHLEVSLLIEYANVSADDLNEFTNTIDQLIQTMKVASGDVLSAKPTSVYTLNESDKDAESVEKKLLRKLMLGHVLIERRDLMVTAMQEGQDALLAMLDYLKVMHRAERTESEEGKEKITWSTKRKTQGWIVPIAVGFQGISKLGQAANQRDADTPHRFAEAVLTLGQFILPYQADNLDQILWQYHFDSDNHLYVCQNQLNSNS